MCFVKRWFDGLNGNVRMIFPECSPKKLKLFLQTSLKYFCETNLTQVMPFHISSFFLKNYIVSRFGCRITVVMANKMDRKSLFCENSVDGFHGFRTSNLTSFNTRFWTRQSDHGEGYLPKLGLLSSPWLFPIFHFTHESVLNDEHLESYLLYRKVLIVYCSSCWG